MLICQHHQEKQVVDAVKENQENQENQKNQENQENQENPEENQEENPEEEEEEEEAIVLNKLNNSINHYIFRNAFCIRLSKVNNVCFINYLTIIFH
jgi:hypothetical protein